MTPQEFCGRLAEKGAVLVEMLACTCYMLQRRNLQTSICDLALAAA